MWPGHAQKFSAGIDASNHDDLLSSSRPHHHCSAALLCNPCLSHTIAMHWQHINTRHLVRGKCSNDAPCVALIGSSQTVSRTPAKGVHYHKDLSSRTMAFQCKCILALILGNAHAEHGIWGSRQAQTGCKPAPLLQHQSVSQAHTHTAQTKVHSTACRTAGGDKRRQVQRNTGGAHCNAAKACAPAAPLSALLLQKAAAHEPQHAPSLARTGSTQHTGLQHPAKGQVGYLRHLPGDQFPRIPSHQQGELQSGLPDADQSRLPNPGAFQSFCVRPSASETSSCEPQPRPLPPRLSGSQPSQTRDAQDASSIDHTSANPATAWSTLR